MKITIDRRWKKENYTIGRLFVNKELFCNTLEDTDRGLDQKQPLTIIKNRKIPNQTAIPTGTYEITLNVMSPKFSKYEYYMDVCDGKLPRLLNVPGFDGILIHVGSNANNTNGCILVGYNKNKGKLTEGKMVFAKLYDLMKEAKKRGEKILIDIY